MFSPVGVNAHDVWAVLRKNPRLFRPDHELVRVGQVQDSRDRKSTRLNSSHLGISYAVFCLKKKKRSPLSLENQKNTQKQNPQSDLPRKLVVPDTLTSNTPM